MADCAGPLFDAHLHYNVEAWGGPGTAAQGGWECFPALEPPARAGAAQDAHHKEQAPGTGYARFTRMASHVSINQNI